MPLPPGASSKWAAYVATLPETLDAPLFWTSEQLAELEGTQLLQNAAGYDSYVRGTYQAWGGKGLGGGISSHFTLHTSHSFSFVCLYFFNRGYARPLVTASRASRAAEATDEATKLRAHNRLDFLDHSAFSTLERQNTRVTENAII